MTDVFLYNEIMNLYDQKTGYVDVASILNAGDTFNFITGGRGIGKTYGFIKYFIESGIPFIFLRRTQIEADLQADSVTSSLTAYLAPAGLHMKTDRIAKKISRISIEETGQEICVCAALSTFASIRGIDLSKYEYILYDEFITEPHVRALKMEGIALFNAYESVNRNRELNGRDPLRLVGLSNSLNIANDVFIQFDIVNAAERMINTGEESFTRGDLLLLILQNSPISRRKKETALYQNASEEYSRMSIDNQFILNDFRYVQKRKISEYICRWSVGDLYVYEHKHREEYYITFTQAKIKRADRYGSNYMDLERMKKDKVHFWFKYISGYVFFDSYKAVALFEKYFK